MPRRPLRSLATWIALLLIVVPLGVIGTLAQNPQQTPPPRRGAQVTAGTPIPGYLDSNSFDIGPRNLFIDCIGSGGPAIILETGFSQPGSAMDMLQAELARTNLTCTYDRAGLGRSGLAPEPRVASDVVADLHYLLEAAGVPAPYVLVGHSAGGVFVQLYARTYPDQVVGVVVMNPVPPANQWLSQALPLMDAWEQSEEAAAYRGEGQSESIDWIASSNQLMVAPAPPPDMPFEMLISSTSQCHTPGDACYRTYEVYRTILEDVTAQWPRGNMTVLQVGFDIYIHAIPDSLAAIQRVISASGIPATPPIQPTPATPIP